MKRTYGGATNGVGAWYGWESDGEAGVGRMEITESSPPSTIMIHLDFVEPFATHNIGAFTLDPTGDSTDVTWAMQGPSPYIAKVMTIFFSMHHLVGKDFETGLAHLKAVAEKL